MAHTDRVPLSVGKHGRKGRSLHIEESVEGTGLGISGSILTVISTTVGLEPHREWTNKEVMVYEAGCSLTEPSL